MEPIALKFEREWADLFDDLIQDWIGGTKVLEGGSNDGSRKGHASNCPAAQSVVTSGAEANAN